MSWVAETRSERDRRSITVKLSNKTNQFLPCTNCLVLFHHDTYMVNFFFPSPVISSNFVFLYVCYFICLPPTFPSGWWPSLPQGAARWEQVSPGGRDVHRQDVGPYSRGVPRQGRKVWSFGLGGNFLIFLFCLMGWMGCSLHYRHYYAYRESPIQEGTHGKIEFRSFLVNVVPPRRYVVIGTVGAFRMHSS